MGFRKPSKGIDRAARALATAGGISHLAFFSLFAWRAIASGMVGRFAHVAFAILALLGLAAEFVGWSLVKFGGVARVKRFGLFAIALSTGLAAILLVVAAMTG